LRSVAQPAFRLLLGFTLGVALLSACQTPSELPRKALPAAATARNGVPVAGDCDGLPAVDLTNLPQRVRCVALVDDTLNFPRGLIAWGTDLIVVDKISNLIQRSLGSRIGRIYRYRKTTAGYEREVLLTGLDNPSAITRGQSKADQHLIYIATPQQILRFNPEAERPSSTLQAVIEDLPTHGWHYLTSVYTRPGALYVTLPSASDHCESAFPATGAPLPYPCPELAEETPDSNATAVIRRYEVQLDGRVNPSFEIVARGLRDALALAFNDVTQQLLAADNGWDDVALNDTAYNDDDHPADEINLLVNGQHYGWPYCFGNGDTTPGYQAHAIDCGDYQQPLILLPAHSAPLAMLFTDQYLVVNLHGFRMGGQRTVLFELDEQGMPRATPETLVHWRYPHRPNNSGGRPFGLALLTENETADEAPVTQQLAITDDWNHALMLIKLR